MKIMYVNNDGGGFAEHIEAEAGTTVNKLFTERRKGRESEDFFIRVNRVPMPADYILQEGDRITITPTKIEGARPLNFALIS